MIEAGSKPKKTRRGLAKAHVSVGVDVETAKFYRAKARSQGWSLASMIYHVLLTHRARYSGLDVTQGSPAASYSKLAPLSGGRNSSGASRTRIGIRARGGSEEASTSLSASAVQVAIDLDPPRSKRRKKR